MKKPGGLQSMGSLESEMTEQLHFHFSLSCIGEGNGNPLQCSCLENPRDGGAWWAAVYGVAQSRTLLKRCSRSSSSLSCCPPAIFILEYLSTGDKLGLFSLGPICLLPHPKHTHKQTHTHIPQSQYVNNTSSSVQFSHSVLSNSL